MRFAYPLVACCLLFVLVPGTPTPESVPTLRSLAEARGFHVGAAVAVSPLLNIPQYADTLSQNYNMVVPENVMKWDATEPTQGTFTFTDADAIVAFAEKNHMAVRGHNLVWHQQLPAWLTMGTYSRDQLLQIMHDHIQGLVSHYKGRILDWDVVNEAVGDGGSMRNDLWLTGIGPDYIEQAFRFAHDADPAAKLFYNDYGGEGTGRKSDAIYALVRDLKQKGVPIDGVGLQMHIGAASGEQPTMEALSGNMQRLAALGLEVQITEMDVKIQNATGTDAEKLAAQAKVYGNVLAVCLQQKLCTALLSWGFTDLYTWIPGFTHKDDAPLPFDKAYQQKPAYQTMLDELAAPPATPQS